MGDPRRSLYFQDFICTIPLRVIEYGMEAERFELEAEEDARWGDPRRCPVHGRATSSPDGLFDSPCPECEAEQDE